MYRALRTVLASRGDFRQVVPAHAGPCLFDVCRTQTKFCCTRNQTRQDSISINIALKRSGCLLYETMGCTATAIPVSRSTYNVALQLYPRRTARRRDGSIPKAVFLLGGQTPELSMARRHNSVCSTHFRSMCRGSNRPNKLSCRRCPAVSSR